MREEPLTIVCFAGCDWWYHNRGLFVSQIMKRLARRHRVLFVNSLGMRMPALGRDRQAVAKIVRKIRSIGRFLRKDACGIHVLSPVSVPLHRFAVGRAINRLSVWTQVRLVMAGLGIKDPVFYIGCPPAWEIIRPWRRRFLIYERTDIFEEMPGANKEYIASLDRQLVSGADLVLYVNRAMYNDGLRANPNCMLIGHGVDYAMFAEAGKDPSIPEDIAGIPHPIAGYFGDMNPENFDCKLMEAVARRLPNVSIVLVGPISTDVSGLQACPNVHLLGQKPYEQVPHYGKVFDVAIMPWLKNRWIEFCNPVKLKEYLALGKPVVSTDYPELAPFHDIVYPANDEKAFAAAIERALGQDGPEARERRRRRVQSETWDSKVEQIEQFIRSHLRESEPAGCSGAVRVESADGR